MWWNCGIAQILITPLTSVASDLNQLKEKGVTQTSVNQQMTDRQRKVELERKQEELKRLQKQLAKVKEAEQKRGMSSQPGVPPTGVVS